jgi:hypothetical protein
MKAAFLIRGAAIAAGLATATAVISAHADEKKNEAKFCTALTALDSDIGQLKSIGPDSTVGEVRAVQGRVDTNAKEVRKAAGKMKTPTAKEFNGAVDQLKADVHNIPDDATLAQVRDKIRSDADNVQTTGKQLASESHCPMASR